MQNKILNNPSRTLRGTLTFWYVTSIAAVIILFAAAVGILLWVTLQDQIDHHVHITVNEAAQIVQHYRGSELDGLIKNLVSAKGMTVVVLTPDGAPLLETNSPDIALVTEHQLQGILASISSTEETPTHFTKGNIRFAALPVQVQAGKGIVAVGYSTQVLYSTFYTMMGIVAGVMVLLVIPISFVGYQLLKQQLSPLERIAMQAQSITSTTALSKRISIVSPTEELKTIQEALNGMLRKMEHIFITEHEFFSDTAHTLKTPLAVLRSQIENAHIAQNVRNNVLQTIDTANDTIGDLLFLSRISTKPPRLETFSLSNLLSDLSELCATLSEDKKLTVTTDIQPNISIISDKKLLQRALSDIIMNAVNYNKPDGGVSIVLKKKRRKIVIIVNDTGIGIPKDDMPKVFSRFFRSSNASANGSGLGLAISKEVIKSLKGKISITSSVGSGTSVTVTM